MKPKTKKHEVEFSRNLPAQQFKRAFDSAIERGERLAKIVWICEATDMRNLRPESALIQIYKLAKGTK